MTKPQLYSMKWNNYQTHVAGTFVQLLESETMVDLTLCAEGEQIRCHRIILSACSPYFQDILSTTLCSHPVVVLSGISADDLKSIIEFVYHGELSVKADRFTSVLKAAETLQICGLMEVQSHLPILEKNEQERVEEEDLEGVHNEQLQLVEESQMGSYDMVVCDQEVEVSTGEHQEIENKLMDNTLDTLKEELSGVSESDANLEIASPITADKIKRRKKRKDSVRKEYSEQELSAALNDLIAGKSLIKTASTYSIPRSTLYSRARAYGLAPVITRQEYSGDKITAAVKAVSAGASLQHASDVYGIPKTVLWRRVQKEVGVYALSRRAKLRQKYSPDVREAAVKALENGENITKVSSEYQIPKTTLFREKSRLIEEGKLPWHYLSKRPQNNDGHKQIRLSQAVAACREGKMSQAAASITFEVPKTTIWRRLQQINSSETNKGEPKTITLSTTEAGADDDKSPLQCKEESEFNLSEVVTYIDDPDYSEASLIILAPGDGTDITLQESGQIVVNNSVVKQDKKNEEVENIIEIVNINSDNVSILPD